MTGRSLAGFFGALIACTTVSGALGALIAAPASLMLAISTLLTLLSCAGEAGGRGSARRIASWLAGVVIGLTLPSTPPATTGNVSTRAPVGRRAGDLFELLDRIDRDPHDAVGRRFAVTGFWKPAVGDDAPAVYRPVMTCCAADAVAVGFDVISSGAGRVKCGRVEVSGTLRALMKDGETRYALADATVTCGTARLRLIAQRNLGARNQLFP